jgi:YVTN family beta-propeller protein
MTKWVGCGLALWSVGAAATAWAQSFPPSARATAEPDEVLVGATVQLSSAGSLDPDNGPEPLSFAWDFGDGTTSTDAAPAHAYAAARAYIATLTVSDGAEQAIATVTVHVLAPPTATRPCHTSGLALAADGRSLWAANPDSSSVSLLDLTVATPVKLAELRVCARPRTVALALDGERLLVTCQGENSIAEIDVAARRVVRHIAVGHEPYGVVVVPTDGRVVVTNQGGDSVVVLAANLEPRASLEVEDGPRAIAVASDGRRAFITHFITRGDTGTVSIVDLETERVAGSIALVEDPGPDTTSSGRGFPNLLATSALDPAGGTLWVGGLKSNTGAGAYRTGSPVPPENVVRGLLAPIDVASGVESLVRRIDTNDADSVSGLAFSPNGRWVYVAHQGAGTLSTYDLSEATLYDPGAGATVPFASRVEVGDAPQSVAVTSDGRRAYVGNFLSRDVTVLDLEDPARPVVAATVPVTSESLAPAVALGKRLFYRSAEPVHSQSNYIACTSCHPDGGMSDGRVWDFTQRGEGLRTTKDLRGAGGLGYGPLHWSANFDEIQDFENDIVLHAGGTGLAQDGLPPNPPLGAPNAGRGAALDGLAAYVSSLTRAPPSPYRGATGELSEAAGRGRVLFESVGCADCHPPPSFTVSSGELIDTGTLTEASGSRLGGPLTGIDPPSLIGLWDRGPYLHDGSARTLRDVFRARPTVLEAELTAALSDPELDDLVAYLLTLDGAADPEAPPVPDAAPEGCACRSSAGALSWLAVLSRRRRPRGRRNQGVLR